MDDRFDEIRDAVEKLVAASRADLIAAISKAIMRVRGALGEAEKASLVEQLREEFAAEPQALQLVLQISAPSMRISTEGTDLRAHRFARVRVAEIQLYHAAALRTGRSSGDLYGALKPQIDAARDAYREKFLTPVNGTADYLHAEFVRTLANDNAALLGPGYPGPLV